MKEVDYPIPGNDSSIASVGFFVKEMISAFEEGLMQAKEEKEKEKEEKIQVEG